MSDEKVREHCELEDWAENGTIDPTYRHLLKWAVTELARLAAEVEDWRKFYRTDWVDVQALMDERDALAERVAELEAKTPLDRLTTFMETESESDCETMAAENARLRSALERLQSGQCFYMPFMFQPGNSAHEEIKAMQEFARQALEVSHE